MSRLEQTQKLIRPSSLVNPDAEHHEHQHSDEEHINILMFILGTQQHSDVQNVHPDFQVKACGATIQTPPSLWGHESHTNTFTLLNCFYSQTSKRSEV